MLKRFALILISLTLGMIRMAGVTHVFFQAIAHCFVGGLIGAYMALGACRMALCPYLGIKRDRRFYLTLAIALSIIETLCFVYSKTIQSH